MKRSFAASLAVAFGAACGVASMCGAALPGQPLATPLATASPVAPPPALPPGGRYLSAGEQLHVQGLAMTGWIFEAPGDIREIAKWLSNQLPVLRDLLVAPGVVVLAGRDARSHWSARLADGGQGWTQGTLSRLPLQQPSGRWPAPPWQPHGARLQFDVRWREAQAASIQQVWTHGAPPAALRPRLRAALLREGWRPAEPDAALAGRWSKASRQLSIVVVEHQAGSGIVTLLGGRE